MNETWKSLRAAIDHADRCVESVSMWTVGHHIEHCALAAERMVAAVAESTPPPKGRRTAVGLMVLKMGKIPRGRGKAPEPSVPQGALSEAELSTCLDRAEAAIEKAAGLDPNQWFRHFAFGTLKRDQAMKLIDIHNRHHLKIIEDIVENSTR
ncbi:MAG: DUF1569 domain-containing protein [Phycisphaeraceae bacterium]|nr:DUF1569 domain-containing protein [Phycisphaeraceae bacterium]